MTVLENRDEKQAKDCEDSHWHISPETVLANDETFTPFAMTLFGQVNFSKIVVHFLVLSGFQDSINIDIIIG